MVTLTESELMPSTVQIESFEKQTERTITVELVERFNKPTYYLVSWKDTGKEWNCETFFQWPEMIEGEAKTAAVEFARKLRTAPAERRTRIEF